MKTETSTGPNGPARAAFNRLRTKLNECEQGQLSNEQYRLAFYAVADVLGLPAMPISPKEAFETVMLPRLRKLVKLEQRHALSDADRHAAVQS